MELDEKQIGFATKCVMEWIELYHVHLKRDPTPADAVHSSLLRRLLSGKKVLPKPPPKRFSCPDYKLAEGEVCDVGEIWEYKKEDLSPDGKYDYPVVVDQCLGWKWVEKNGSENDRGVPETGVLEYSDGSRYRFWWGSKTFRRLNCVNGELTGGFTEFMERTKFIQLIMEEDNAGKDRDVHSLGQPNQ